MPQGDASRGSTSELPAHLRKGTPNKPTPMIVRYTYPLVKRMAGMRSRASENSGVPGVHLATVRAVAVKDLLLRARTWGCLAGFHFPQNASRFVAVAP